MTSQPNNSSRKRWLAAAGLVVLVGIAVWFRQRAAQQSVLQTPIESQATDTNSPPTIRRSPSGTAVVSVSKSQESVGLLQTAPDAATARQRLAELRARLASMPTNAAVAEIRQFLDSKADTPTRLGFKVAKNGLLDEAPTLRTFLLDELARLDPAAAADYAKVVLASKDSPDEWAVALRNLARGDTSADGRAVLEQKAGEMLRHEPWQGEPAVGFLEAFDVAVFIGGTKLMPALADLLQRKDNPAVAHASFLALDRLVINDPAGTLTALQAAPDLLEGRELTRANYFARADVRDASQRQILESYLINLQLSPAELEAFAGVYPNANFMISPNLLTQLQTPDRAALLARDAESLRVVQQWLGDPRFARLRPGLEKMALRLQEFVRQANQGQ